MDHVTIITASEAFNYPPDHVRLSYLITQNVQRRIQQAFQFQQAAITQPPATFGPVELTNPPGLVYEWGEWSEDGLLIPIRVLHIESRRVVWQIAGAHTHFIDAIMRHLLDTCATSLTAEGKKILEPWAGTQWFSELSFTLDIAPDTWHRSFPLLQLIDDAIYTVIPPEKKTLPAVTVFNYRPDDVFPGEYRPWHGSKFTLTLRAGTSIADNTYYSAAPLQTDAHIALVQRIEKYLQTQE
jgi:hypothetical protein